MNPITIQNLSPDNMRSIALILPYDDIISLCDASKQFEMYICQSESFWLQLIQRDLTSNPDR